MRTIPKIAAIATLLATGPSTIAADGVAVRTGWYLGAGLGAGAVSRLEQKGWNRDSFCYPDATCFDEEPIPEVPGYRWRYDVDLVGGEAFDLSFGRFFGQIRLELVLAQQTNGARQTFAGIVYGDGSPIRPRPGGTVVSNGRGSIDLRRARSVSLDAFYDFPGAWGAISPYLGGGAGQTFVEMTGVQFATDYRNVSTAAELYDPPLSFYNSVQDTDLNDTAWVLRVHVGADYTLSARASLGLKLTLSATGDNELAGGYVTHCAFRPKLPPIPAQSCHLFRLKVATPEVCRRGAATCVYGMTVSGSWWH